MELVAIILVVALVLVAGYALWRRSSAQAKAKHIEREKLDSVATGHREMADAHVSSVEELEPKAKAHRDAAVDHARRADELEDRVERERRQAEFHSTRATETEVERERIR